MHIPDHSCLTADERLLIVLKHTQYNTVLETTRCFQRQSSIQRVVQINVNGQVYGQVCQDGQGLIKNISNRGCQRQHKLKLSAIEAHSQMTPSI